MLNKGFPAAAPWRVISGGTGQCSFSTRNTSVNLGFSHSVMASPEAAAAATAEMRQAVTSTSLVAPMPILGDLGFAYQPKAPTGGVDPASMFFQGHRGRVTVSGYLNLRSAITAAERDLAAGLIAQTLGVASRPKALARQENSRYLDPELVRRLLPADDFAAIVPDANNCVLSAGGRAMTLAISRDTRGRATMERQLKGGGCTVDPLKDLGKGGFIAHHCGTGNPRAEVLFASNGRTVRLLFAPASEPSAEERATLVELARFAATR